MNDLAKLILADVSEGREFVLHHGKRRTLKNLLDLKFELRTMSVEEFNYHVTSVKNDFANWINDVVGDEKLAHDVQKAKSKTAMLDLITARVDFAITLIEQENKKIVSSELERLKRMSGESKTNISHQISYLEKDLNKLAHNIDFEREITVPLAPSTFSARVVEFLFGLAVGIAIGLLIGSFLFR